MGSLDVSERIVSKNGVKLFADWRRNLERFYEQSRGLPGMRIMDDINLLDRTKINIIVDDLSVDGKRMDGNTLADILREDYNIFAELSSGDLVMCMSGIGNQTSDYERLLHALTEISAKYYDPEAKPAENIPQDIYGERAFFGIPNETQSVNLADSAGMICGAMIIPYPPGIPILCPGEKIDAEIIRYVTKLRARGAKVLGMNEKNEIIVSLKLQKES
jgi:lysine decarboxylase